MINEYGADFFKWQNKSKCIGICWLSHLIFHSCTKLQPWQTLSHPWLSKINSLPYNKLRYEAPNLETKEVILYFLVSAITLIRNGKPQELRQTSSFTVSSIMMTLRFEPNTLQWETNTWIPGLWHSHLDICGGISCNVLCHILSTDHSVSYYQFH